LADGLREDARTLSEQAVAFIRPHLPELFPDPESVEENRASTEASIRGAAEMIASGADPRTVELPAATAAYAQSGVRQGIPFPALLRSYRLGHEAVSDAVIERIAGLAGDPEMLARATRLCSAWMFGYVDAALSAAERTYDEEQARWLRSTAASRAETVAAVLDGRQRDPDLAGKRLRYRLDRQHVAAIAWLDAAEKDANPLPSLEEALAEVGVALGADSPLVHPLGLLAAAAWFGSGQSLEGEALRAIRLGPGAAPGVRVAVGQPAVGIEGFRRSYEEAGEARRVASLAVRPSGSITLYEHVALAALATSNLALARDFVARELGPLAADDDVSLRLVGTLRAYLNEQASRSRAAKRLGIHENTVRYRVRQAEELLERPVDERTLELQVALAIVDVVRAAETD
jgi:hypothetical protein